MISSQTTSLRSTNRKTGEKRTNSRLNRTAPKPDGQLPKVRYVVYCKLPTREQTIVELPTFIEIASDPTVRTKPY